MLWVWFGSMDARHDRKALPDEIAGRPDIIERSDF
jgi:hypothetical protein